MDISLSSLRVTTTDDEPVRVAVRRHQFEVGHPVDFDVEAPHISALEYALGALGAEVVSGVRAFAKRRRVAIDHIEAVVKGELENALTYLEVVGETGCPTLSHVGVRVYVSSPEDARTMTALWNETIARLPLVCSLRAAVDLSLELTLTP